MHRLFLFPLLALAGCSTNTQFEPPVVDSRGREATVMADQNECISKAQRESSGSSWVGAPVTACMRAKGYPIISGRS